MSPFTASRGSKESPSTELSGASGTGSPPLSKSRLPLVEFTPTSEGRRWNRSVPGPGEVPKSPWLCAQVCSRFHWSPPPPFASSDMVAPL